MRERGLKCVTLEVERQEAHVAPHAGAWVEICCIVRMRRYSLSLPMRERGLKFENKVLRWFGVSVAPHAGAWVEIPMMDIWMTG